MPEQPGGMERVSLGGLDLVLLWWVALVAIWLWEKLSLQKCRSYATGRVGGLARRQTSYMVAEGIRKFSRAGQTMSRTTKKAAHPPKCVIPALSPPTSSMRPSFINTNMNNHFNNGAKGKGKNTMKGWNGGPNGPSFTSGHPGRERPFTAPRAEPSMGNAMATSSSSAPGRTVEVQRPMRYSHLPASCFCQNSWVGCDPRWDGQREQMGLVSLSSNHQGDQNSPSSMAVSNPSSIDPQPTEPRVGFLHCAVNPLFGHHWDPMSQTGPVSAVCAKEISQAQEDEIVAQCIPSPPCDASIVGFVAHLDAQTPCLAPALSIEAPRFAFVIHPVSMAHSFLQTQGLNAPFASKVPQFPFPRHVMEENSSKVMMVRGWDEDMEMAENQRLAIEGPPLERGGRKT